MCVKAQHAWKCTGPQVEAKTIGWMRRGEKESEGERRRLGGGETPDPLLQTYTPRTGSGSGFAGVENHKSSYSGCFD